jgi:hypothetical protein
MVLTVVWKASSGQDFHSVPLRKQVLRDMVDLVCRCQHKLNYDKDLLRDLRLAGTGLERLK